MKFLRGTFLFSVMTMAPFGVSAQQYINGWTESAFKGGVNGCVASAVPKQMQFMSNSGQIKPGATQVQIEAARTRVTNIETSICTCTQQQIMRDIRFEDVQSILERPDYVRQVATTCSNETLKNQK
jgi:hypothetical protein